MHGEIPGRTVLGKGHPVGAPNKTLISDTVLTPGRLVLFPVPSFILSTMQAGTTPIYNIFGMTGPSRNRESNPQNLLVGAIIAFYNQQGLLRTYSSPGGSIRSLKPRSPRCIRYIVSDHCRYSTKQTLPSLYIKHCILIPSRAVSNVFFVTFHISFRNGLPMSPCSSFVILL